MKTFSIALVFILLIFVSFSHADAGWATGYGNLAQSQSFSCSSNCTSWSYPSIISVLVYNELLAKIKEVKATIRSESTKQAIQTVYDDIKSLVTWLRQKDGQQMLNTVSKLENDLYALESQLNLISTQPLRERVHYVATKIKQLRILPIPPDQFVNTLNKIMKEFNDKLKEISR